MPECVDMPTSTITIEVDADTAKAFAEIPPEQRQRFVRWFGQTIRAFKLPPQQRLKQVMDEMGAEAARQGMTPEILDAILDESR
jgi:hypothetical protein